MAKKVMTEDEIRAWLETLCQHCVIVDCVAECLCSLCNTRCCSVHRNIYGETIVCSVCWRDIKDGRKQVSPELHRMMDESAARAKKFMHENFGW